MLHVKKLFTSDVYIKFLEDVMLSSKFMSFHARHISKIHRKNRTMTKY